MRFYINDFYLVFVDVSYLYNINSFNYLLFTNEIEVYYMIDNIIFLNINYEVIEHCKSINNFAKNLKYSYNYFLNFYFLKKIYYFNFFDILDIYNNYKILKMFNNNFEYLNYFSKSFKILYKFYFLFYIFIIIYIIFMLFFSKFIKYFFYLFIINRKNYDKKVKLFFYFFRSIIIFYLKIYTKDVELFELNKMKLKKYLFFKNYDYILKYFLLKNNKLKSIENCFIGILKFNYINLFIFMFLLFYFCLNIYYGLYLYYDKIISFFLNKFKFILVFFNLYSRVVYRSNYIKKITYNLFNNESNYLFRLFLRVAIRMIEERIVMEKFLEEIEKKNDISFKFKKYILIYYFVKSICYHNNNFLKSSKELEFEFFYKKKNLKALKNRWTKHELVDWSKKFIFNYKNKDKLKDDNIAKYKKLLNREEYFRFHTKNIHKFNFIINSYSASSIFSSIWLFGNKFFYNNFSFILKIFTNKFKCSSYLNLLLLNYSSLLNSFLYFYYIFFYFFFNFYRRRLYYDYIIIYKYFIIKYLYDKYFISFILNKLYFFKKIYFFKINYFIKYIYVYFFIFFFNRLFYWLVFFIFNKFIIFFYLLMIITFLLNINCIYIFFYFIDIYIHFFYNIILEFIPIIFIFIDKVNNDIIYFQYFLSLKLDIYFNYIEFKKYEYISEFENLNWLNDPLFSMSKKEYRVKKRKDYGFFKIFRRIYYNYNELFYLWKRKSIRWFKLKLYRIFSWNNFIFYAFSVDNDFYFDFFFYWKNSIYIFFQYIYLILKYYKYFNIYYIYFLVKENNFFLYIYMIFYSILCLYDFAIHYIYIDFINFFFLIVINIFNFFILIFGKILFFILNLFIFLANNVLLWYRSEAYWKYRYIYYYIFILLLDTINIYLYVLQWCLWFIYKLLISNIIYIIFKFHFLLDCVRNEIEKLYMYAFYNTYDIYDDNDDVKNMLLLRKRRRKRFRRRRPYLKKFIKFLKKRGIFHKNSFLGYYEYFKIFNLDYLFRFNELKYVNVIRVWSTGSYVYIIFYKILYILLFYQTISLLNSKARKLMKSDKFNNFEFFYSWQKLTLKNLEDYNIIEHIILKDSLKLTKKSEDFDWYWIYFKNWRKLFKRYKKLQNVDFNDKKKIDYNVWQSDYTKFINLLKEIKLWYYKKNIEREGYKPFMENIIRTYLEKNYYNNFLIFDFYDINWQRKTMKGYYLLENYKKENSMKLVVKWWKEFFFNTHFYYYNFKEQKTILNDLYNDFFKNYDETYLYNSKWVRPYEINNLFFIDNYLQYLQNLNKKYYGNFFYFYIQANVQRNYYKLEKEKKRKKKFNNYWWEKKKIEVFTKKVKYYNKSATINILMIIILIFLAYVIKLIAVFWGGYMIANIKIIRKLYFIIYLFVLIIIKCLDIKIFYFIKEYFNRRLNIIEPKRVFGITKILKRKKKEHRLLYKLQKLNEKEVFDFYKINLVQFGCLVIEFEIIFLNYKWLYIDLYLSLYIYITVILLVYYLLLKNNGMFNKK